MPPSLREILRTRCRRSGSSGCRYVRFYPFHSGAHFLCVLVCAFRYSTLDWSMCGLNCILSSIPFRRLIDP